jgi:2,4-dienoyl-CoA reductase-like NADH-dependent reductase (Old Yellow Enzyme family)
VGRVVPAAAIAEGVTGLKSSAQAPVGNMTESRHDDGGVDLKNRIALAPMTRVSATSQGLATEPDGRTSAGPWPGGRRRTA